MFKAALGLVFTLLMIELALFSCYGAIGWITSYTFWNWFGNLAKDWQNSTKLDMMTCLKPHLD